MPLGINWVLSDKNRHKELCVKAREKAVACFDIKKVARQYAELYREVLGLKLKAGRWKEKMNIERPTSNVEWEEMERR